MEKIKLTKKINLFQKKNLKKLNTIIYHVQE